MDSGRTPDLLAPNQTAFQINCTNRGGWVYPRGGFWKRTLDWQGNEDAEAAFKDSLFQGGFPYVYDNGQGALISMHGGRQFRINVQNFAASEISTPGYENNPTIPIAWGIQAENFLIIQDGQSRPFIFNGASSRRAEPSAREIPVGRQMAYYGGRIWLANGREYIAGNIVYGPPSYSRAAILKFDENDYLNEGGSFGVPAQFGEITALQPIASINTVLGQGELIVGTRNGVFATAVPFNRDDWKNLNQPAQRVIQLVNGPMSQASVVPVNEDLFYRARDGQRSLRYSVRNDAAWGNRSISNEMIRVLSQDSESFLGYGSAVLFDGRLLQTASPGYAQGHGVYHRCLTSLDFDPITSMRETLQPAWEGIWTGLKILKIVVVEHIGVERCFMYVLNDDNEIEIWEATKDETYDYNGEDKVRIEWTQESKAFTFGSKFDNVKLNSEDIWYDRVRGDVEFTMEYRPESYPCWFPWATWSECAKFEQCRDDFGTCDTIKNYQEQYRPKRTLPQPPDSYSDILLVPDRVASQFQTRLTIKGFCRLKQQKLSATLVEETPFPNPV